MPIRLENIDLVRRAFAELGDLMAASSKDVPGPLAPRYESFVRKYFDPDFELVPASSAVERRTLRGADGFATFMEGGGDTWSGAVLEAEEFVEAGDRVLVVGSFRAAGRTSGVEIVQLYGTVWTVREGRVRRIQIYLDPAEARAALAAANAG